MCGENVTLVAAVEVGRVHEFHASFWAAMRFLQDVEPEVKARRTHRGTFTDRQPCRQSRNGVNQNG